jgi:hypothetical protein
MSAQLRRSSRRKRPTPIAAARKRVRTPDVVATVAESVNAEITSASSRVVVPGSDAQYWLAQVIPATSTTQGLFLIFQKILCQVIAYVTI